jgi:ribose-phosphate pyrophosphokinase
MLSNFKIFSGNSNPQLSKKVADNLDISMGNAHVGRFSDGECAVEIKENVRGQDVFIIQSVCYPTNDNLMELMIIADAIRRSSAARITAVIPYFGYSRQDRRPRSSRVAISAKVVADMLSSVGFNRILTCDLHADQIQGFFNIPVDNIYGSPLFLEDIIQRNYKNAIVVSPDHGGVVRARAIAKRIDTDLAIIDKRRPEANKSQVMNVIGDISGRTCIMVDDMVDTAGTLCKAAEALKDRGALAVHAYSIHPVLSGKALENIASSPIDSLVVTNTIPLSAQLQATGKIRQLDISFLIAEAIRRIINAKSISEMFQ